MTRSIVRRAPLTAAAIFLLGACGGSSQSGETASSDPETSSGGSTSSEGFQLSSSDTADQARGDHPSEITSTETHAAVRFFVVDPDAGPNVGVVIKLTAPDGETYYTHETDSVGYAEALVPAGQRYELEYLSLGRRSARAHVDVPAGPRQDIRLTLRHRRWHPPARAVATPEAGAPAAAEEPTPEPAGLVLEGILFDSGAATIQAESNARLDRVVEYMTHMPSVRIRVSGHTDNVGDPRANQRLSEARAEAVRAYLVSHGIDGGRVEAVGYGDQRPVASNGTDEGRSANRRIEAEEL